MPYDFAPLKKRTDKIKEWLQGEFSLIRTGRAAPAILDSIKVNSYGNMTPINHVGTVTVEDARTLRIAPWDKGHVKLIEKAINDAGLGLSVNSSEDGVRVIFPELTAERRAGLTKLAGTKLEEARVSLRQERDDVWGDIQKKEKEGTLTEDEKFRFKEDMQKIVDATNKELDGMLERKEREISA
ncbi:MAG TPA: ribosome recycling factor [Candidatus Paceibacterota bacterium]